MKNCQINVYKVVNEWSPLIVIYVFKTIKKNDFNCINRKDLVRNGSRRIDKFMLTVLKSNMVGGCAYYKTKEYFFVSK